MLSSKNVLRQHLRVRPNELSTFISLYPFIFKRRSKSNLLQIGPWAFGRTGFLPGHVRKN